MKHFYKYVLLKGQILSLIVTYLGSSAFACKDIRLDDPGKPLSHTAVLDQDGVDDCFANSAAILIDAWRFSHDTPVGDNDYSHLTYPLDLGIQYTSLHPGSDLHSGGSVPLLLKDVKKIGSCDPTRSFDSNSDVPQKLKDWLRSQFQDFQKCKESVVGSSKSLECMKQVSSAEKIIPDLKSVEKAFGTQGTLDELQKALAPACSKGKRKSVGGYHVVNKNYTSPNDMSADVDQELSKPNPQPMSIGFCSNILEKGGSKYDGISWDVRAIPKQGCKLHAAVVIGEKTLPNGKCKVILQNSWGTSCNSYPDSIECSDGKIAIDSDLLYNNAVELTHLEEETTR